MALRKANGSISPSRTARQSVPVLSCPRKRIRHGPKELTGTSLSAEITSRPTAEHQDTARAASSAMKRIISRP